MGVPGWSGLSTDGSGVGFGSPQGYWHQDLTLAQGDQAEKHRYVRDSGQFRSIGTTSSERNVVLLDWNVVWFLRGGWENGEGLVVAGQGTD